MPEKESLLGQFKNIFERMQDRFKAVEKRQPITLIDALAITNRGFSDVTLFVGAVEQQIKEKATRWCNHIPKDKPCNFRMPMGKIGWKARCCRFHYGGVCLHQNIEAGEFNENSFIRLNAVLALFEEKKEP